MPTYLCASVYKKSGSLEGFILSEVFCWNMGSCKCCLGFTETLKICLQDKNGTAMTCRAYTWCFPR